MDKLFLGLDCSTQSLTGIIIDFNLNTVVCRNSINFDKELPHYNTQNGVVVLDNEKVIHSYPLMWVEALELLFEKMKDSEISFFEIKAISGSGQQHGTVYLNSEFVRNIEQLDVSKTLVSQLKNSFSRQTSPIWMDSSTTKQCDEVREKLGGLKSTIRLLGSNTIERFSGPQIRKFFQLQPELYEKTSIIHLVSSFMASIMLGKSALIDHGDGAGMNLMNIRTKKWDERALEATAPNLREKLPPLIESYGIIGKISSYFVEKYGFNPDTNLIAWSGDNPNSLIGVGLIEKGKVAISLGTSDTYFGYLQNLFLDYRGEGHVFGAPTGDYMSLICYKNGSLARERIKDKFNLSWEKFSEILNKTPHGNNGKLMLPYFFPETVPQVLEPKVCRFGFDENDIEGNIRGIIEAQFLSMRLHSEWIGEKPNEIYATGGASANRDILQVMANIFNTKVRKFEFTDSAALGAAFRAAKSYYDLINKEKTWDEIINKFIDFKKSILIKPNKEYIKLYDDMLDLYGKCESFILKNGEDPEIARLEFINKYF
ncbi:MAG: carbohydrate kinase [Candidatus Lokiarchaeota archaeon]|nr:carbohydrate kinase [Candidatus Lokiarchaeota archaeon]